MAQSPTASPSDSTEAEAAGHPTPDTTAGAPPDPNLTYVDRPAKTGTEAEEARKEGPGHAS